MSTSALSTMPKPLAVWITTNWTILKEIGIPDHFIRLLEIYMQVKKQQLERARTGFNLGKQHVKVVYFHPIYLTYMQSTSCKMVFPVVMYVCERWTIKKAEHERTDAFEQWCWRRLLRVPWTARRSNQSILKEISPEYSLEGLLLKLKFRSFGHLLGGTDSLEKIQILGKIVGGRRRG